MGQSCALVGRLLKGLALCVRACVCTEFVSGSPPPLPAAVLEGPRHECDERLTSEEQTDTVSGGKGDVSLSPDLAGCSSRQAAHLCAHSRLFKYRCANRPASASIPGIDKQGMERAWFKPDVIIIVSPAHPASCACMSHLRVVRRKAVLPICCLCSIRGLI